MTDGASSTDAHSQLHRLQVCKLLQYKDLVVCPEGLNSQIKASQFTFKELPLWDAAAGKPACEPQLMVVDLGSMQPDGITPTIQTPHATPVLPPPPADTVEPSNDTTSSIHLQLIGSME